MDIFKRCIDRQKRIDKVVSIIDNDDITSKNLLVKERIINPVHYVVMLGETSSGKSALINSIFDKKILVESVKPTTGVVTEIVIDSEAEKAFIAIKKDSSVETLDRDKFETLTTKPDEDLYKLKYVGACKESRYNGMRLLIPQDMDH